MSPKVGCHIRIREKALPLVRQFYPAIGGREEMSYLVTFIEVRQGRKVIYFQLLNGDTAAAWAGHVVPLPRCRVCDSEEHKTPKPTAKNPPCRFESVAA